MSEPFYADARLYDRLFPGGEPAVDFYRAQAARQGGRVLELGCGTGRKLIPLASDGHPCTGLDLSPAMLDAARSTAEACALAVEWVQGDMRDVDLGRAFDLVFSAGNSLLHLHEAADLVSCFRSVRAHLAPGGRFVFDVFNPDVRLLAGADGVRRTRDALSFEDPDRGRVTVDVAETYDAAAQVTRGTWRFSTDAEPDFLVAPLELRSIFPQELPLLLSLAGLRLVERFGDWSAGRSPATRRSSSVSARRTEEPSGRPCGDVASAREQARVRRRATTDDARRRAEGPRCAAARRRHRARHGLPPGRVPLPPRGGGPTVAGRDRDARHRVPRRRARHGGGRLRRRTPGRVHALRHRTRPLGHGHRPGCRFYERLGWMPTGERSHSAFPPQPELLRYERDLTSSAEVSAAAR